MAHAMLLSVLFMIMLAMSSADILKNSDFESPPTNITANSTAPFVLLTEANTIPGWLFSGTVLYVTSGPNVSLPGNGHAVQLGKGGKINQTFIINDNSYVEYVLTFTLALGTEDCSKETMAVKVSSPHTSGVFSFKGRYGKEKWESHAFPLGRWIDQTTNIASVDIESVSRDDEHANSIVTCWPVVDTLLLTRIEELPDEVDMIVNGGFEVGPTFLSNSSEGILLDEEPAGHGSAVQEWAALGMVKYIDSKHYSVPKGKAAIELLSGAPSGIQTIRGLSQGTKYTLGFMMGDANDSCVADFILYAQAGIYKKKFTMQSNGTGLSRQYYMTFKALSVVNTISFQSFNESQTSEGVFCGPVIDKVTLRASFSLKLKLHNGVSVLCFVLTLVILLLGR